VGFCPVERADIPERFEKWEKRGVQRWISRDGTAEGENVPCDRKPRRMPRVERRRSARWGTCCVIMMRLGNLVGEGCDGGRMRWWGAWCFGVGMPSVVALGKA